MPHVVSQYLQPIESRSAESIPESGPPPAVKSDHAIIDITAATLVIPPAKPIGLLTIAEYNLKRKGATEIDLTDEAKSPEPAVENDEDFFIYDVSETAPPQKNPPKLITSTSNTKYKILLPSLIRVLKFRRKVRRMKQK
jgi:hypothetical protein